MFDFIVSVAITFMKNIQIVPQLDAIRTYHAQNSYDFTNQYHLMVAASYIGVGMIVYVFIYIVKFVLREFF